MGHEEEPSVLDRAVAELEAQYGRSNVDAGGDNGVWLPGTERYVDVVVDARENGSVVEPDFYAVEVEDDVDGAIESAGQTLIYEGDLSEMGLTCEGVIVVPDGHTDGPDMDYISDDVRIEEVPPPAGG